jgi:adenylate cyclase
MRSGEDTARNWAQLMRYARELAAAAPYLPHELRKRISNGETSSERCQVAVLFADLVDFTKMASVMDPKDVFGLLNDCFQKMVRPVLKHHGWVPSLPGDGIMAVFRSVVDAPESDEDEGVRAVRAALEMTRRMRDLSREMRLRLGVSLRLRTGISCGEAMVGSVGVGQTLSYTAVGKIVNLAYRLQEEAPPGVILVSQSVQQATQELFNYRYFDALPIKGFEEPVPAFVVKSRQKPKG